MNPRHELTRRFLTLPFRHQIDVVRAFDFLPVADHEVFFDEELFGKLFRQVASKGLLAKLWDETEKRHAIPSTSNPFYRG